MTDYEKAVIRMDRIYELLVSFDSENKKELEKKINYLAEQLNIEIPEDL